MCETEQLHEQRTHPVQQLDGRPGPAPPHGLVDAQGVAHTAVQHAVWRVAVRTPVGFPCRLEPAAIQPARKDQQAIHDIGARRAQGVIAQGEFEQGFEDDVAGIILVGEDQRRIFADRGEGAA